MDIFEDMFDESGALSSVNTETGKTLSSLVKQLRSVEMQIEDAESHLKTLKQVLSHRCLVRTAQ